MTDEFYGGGKKRQEGKAEKWPATEPEATHQDVRAGFKPARSPHLGSFLKIKKSKGMNRAQTKRGMERKQKGDVIHLQRQICSSAEGLSSGGSGFVMDFWSRSGFCEVPRGCCELRSATVAEVTVLVESLSGCLFLSNKIVEASRIERTLASVERSFMDEVRLCRVLRLRALSKLLHVSPPAWNLADAALCVF